MTRQKLMKALEIFGKYPSKRNYLASEHDEIWVGGPSPEVMSEEDRAFLEEECWAWVPSDDAWNHGT